MISQFIYLFMQMTLDMKITIAYLNLIALIEKCIEFKIKINHNR